MFAKIFKGVLIIVLLTISVSIMLGATASSKTAYGMGHEYIVIDTVPPTCTEDGLNILFCINCGKVVEEVLYALGCDWGPWVVEREPTCTVEGLRRAACRDCNRSRTEAIPMREHSFQREEEEATCLEPGGIVYVCSVCGYVDDEFSEDALGHMYVEDIVKEPSCLEPGLMEIWCEDCDYTRTEVFGEPTGHDFNEIIVSEATCNEAGVKSFVCVICDYSYEEVIPALTHSWGEWVVEVYPEEGIEGVRYKSCAYCEERISEVIPALPIPPEPEPEQPFIGVEEVVVGGANIAALYVLYVLLFGELSALLWYRKRKKDILARENQKKANERFGEAL